MARTILVLGAVAGELAALTDRLEARSPIRTGGELGIRGRLADQPVCLLETGVGLINTARVLTAAIGSERPGLVIQTGCAGAFEAAGLSVGDIGIASLEIDAQLGVETPGTEGIVSPLVFPVVGKGSLTVRNTYPMDPGLVERAHTILKETMAAGSAKIFVGPFITVVTVTATAKRAGRLHAHHGAIMENMEGAAAAHVCLHYDIPFLEIRAAANRVGCRDKDAWDLPLAFERSAWAVCAVIDRLAPHL